MNGGKMEDERIEMVWKQTSGTGKRKFQWINFARHSSRDNCIGKGRMKYCSIVEGKEEIPRQLHIEMELDGEPFMGILYSIAEEEE